MQNGPVHDSLASLSHAGFLVNIRVDPSGAPTEIPVLRVQVIDPRQEGAVVIDHAHTLSVEQTASFQAAMQAYLQEGNPALITAQCDAYLPTALADQRALDSAFDLMCDALRHDVEGPAAVLLWNSVNELNEQYTDLLRHCTHEALESLSMHPAITRAQVGAELKAAWELAASLMMRTRYDRWELRGEEHLSTDRFQILAFGQAVALAPLSDWIWGITRCLINESST